jgi:predicted nucleic acid-binding protein
MRLLDTDVLIDFQRQYPPAMAWYASLTEVPSVPGLAIMELIQDAQNRRQVQEVLRLVAPMPVVWPTEADCARALDDFTTFHLSHPLYL